MPKKKKVRSKQNSRVIKNSKSLSRTKKNKGKQRKKAVAGIKKVGRVGLEAYLTYTPNGSKRRSQLNTLKRVLKS